MQIFYIILFYIHSTFAIPSIDKHPEIDVDYNYYAVMIKEPTSTDLDNQKGWIHLRKRSIQELTIDHYHATMKNVCREYGCEIVGQIGNLEGHYLVKKKQTFPPGMEEDVYHRNALSKHDQIEWAIHQKPRMRSKKSVIPKPELYKRQNEIIDAIRDPLFGDQWHLVNKNVAGADINVTGVWKMNITGTGVVTTVIDDGVDYDHDDLRNNFFAPGSYDFNLKRDLPKPMLEDDFHGTRCAGEIAAVKNDVCGVGVAYNAKVSGLRILGGPITDVDEALAILYKNDLNQIYSCSWGPSDDGKHVEGPNELVTSAIVKGAEKGRNGLGNVFVFATGNGGYFKDNCNYDGYTNSIYAISIGAIGHDNKHPMYSEECSAHLAVTYSSGSARSIVTTDVRPANCTANHGGTSAAAPLAVGMLALALSANPSLSYRDMQHLVFRSAVPVDLDDQDWEKTYIGRMYSHKYGYGRLDAYRVVMNALDWKNVGPRITFSSPEINVNLEIPFGNDGLKSTFDVKQSEFNSSGINYLEHVTVTVTITHQQRGDLDLFLISPHNVISHIGPNRPIDRSDQGFNNWTFSTVKHWEEDPVGTWTLRIVDKANPLKKGHLVKWKLNLHGNSGFGTLRPRPDDKNAGNGAAVVIYSVLGICVVLVVIGVVTMAMKKYHSQTISNGGNHLLVNNLYIDDIMLESEGEDAGMYSGDDAEGLIQ